MLGPIKIIQNFNPDIVIHLAAMTAVDLCETDQDSAFKINSEATEILAKESSKINAFIVYVSTDYVFDGKKKGFYKAFALGAKTCDLCDPCTVSTYCQHPEKARPTLQACGIDVATTVDKNGWADLAPNKPCSESHAIGMVLLS